VTMDFRPPRSGATRLPGGVMAALVDRAR
jgi:hypothetical protein